MNISNITIPSAPVETTPFDTQISVLGQNKVVGANKIDAAEKTSNPLSEPNNGQANKLKAEQEREFSAEQAEQLAIQMNEIMDDLQTSLGFSIREDLDHQVVVEITDRKTKELIKQIPTEEMLAIKEKMEEFSGLLFDQKV